MNATARIRVYGREGIRAYALVDSEDYEELSRYRWHMRDYYAIRRLSQQSDGCRPLQSMHRQVLGLAVGDASLVGHHRNRNTLDNRRENLEAISPYDNAQRRRLADVSELVKANAP